MNINNFIGIGLRHPHYHEVLETKPSIAWLEVHSENFFFEGGPSLHYLKKIREHYPLSLHGIGLSLGSADGICTNHLEKLYRLIEETNPFLISEHLSWNMLNNTSMPDLFPFPYTTESLNVFCNNIDAVQNFLKKQLLIENPSTYVQFKSSQIEEPLFLNLLQEKTGCALLLDVNNIYVSSVNHSWDPLHYINEIPKNVVKEIHIAGHDTKVLSDNVILKVDTHDNFVCDEVFKLYEHCAARFGIVPSLLEWDSNIPSLNVLIEEAEKFKKYIPVERHTDRERCLFTPQTFEKN